MTIKRNRTANRYFTDFQVISRRQIEFGIYIRNYRRYHNLSQWELANIAKVYGVKENVNFSGADICNYENFTCIPSEKKMKILMDVMHITMKDLA